MAAQQPSLSLSSFAISHNTSSSQDLPSRVEAQQPSLPISPATIPHNTTSSQDLLSRVEDLPTELRRKIFRDEINRCIAEDPTCMHRLPALLEKLSYRQNSQLYIEALNEYRSLLWLTGAASMRSTNKT